MSCKRIVQVMLVFASFLFSDKCVSQPKIADVPMQPIQIVASGAEVVKCATGFTFTEGPAVDSEGNVYFTDAHKSEIHLWSVDGKLSAFFTKPDWPVGLYFARDGDLIATCAFDERKLISIDRKGNATTLVDRYNNKKFNCVNDLWIDLKGGIYFSDPDFGDDTMELDRSYVFYLPPGSDTVVPVIGDISQPNGLVGSPDGKLLYVSNNKERKTYVYGIKADGTLSGKRLFAEAGWDGVTVDSGGNVYITGEVITVYDPKGNLIETIETPEKPSNLSFGGSDNKTLFITARTSLYSLKMNVSGAVPLRSKSPINPGATMKKLADGFEFIEGPTADKDGNIFFADFEASMLYKWSLTDGLSTFNDEKIWPCGMFTEKDGSLLVCAGHDRHIFSIDMDGEVTEVASTYNGNRLNGPNDLWIDPKGGFYFTDPDWERWPSELGGGFVFYMKPDRKTLVPVVSDIKIPNGIIGTPDGKTLYVADNYMLRTYRYSINEDGTLYDKTLFAPYGYDGMTIDSVGNIYITGKAITIYNPEGTLIDIIETTENSSNMTFGGEDNSTLFITTPKAFWSLDTRVKGGNHIFK